MTDASPTGPPRWASTSWGLNSGSRSPSDPGLSASRIVQTAVELADEDGLAALSIRKLGQRLGAGTMAAYRHIDSRDDLVILMVDVALGPPDAGIVQASTWQEGSPVGPRRSPSGISRTRGSSTRRSAASRTRRIRRCGWNTCFRRSRQRG